MRRFLVARCRLPKKNAWLLSAESPRLGFHVNKALAINGPIHVNTYDCPLLANEPIGGPCRLVLFPPPPPSLPLLHIGRFLILPLTILHKARVF